MIDLRPYQQAALDAVLAAPTRGIWRPVVALPTGTGKTVLFAHLIAQRSGRSLILVHRDELIRQAYAKLKEIIPTLSVGVVQAERDEHTAPCVIASVQTLGREARLSRVTWDFATIIVDECFPAGTLVDGRPIEDIRVGDFVRSFNHATGMVEQRKVTRRFVSRPSSLVTVQTTDGRKISSTFGHPFWTRDGYVQAGLLRPGQHLFQLQENHTDGIPDSGILRGMRPTRGDRQQKPQGGLPPIWQNVLLSDLPGYLGQSEQFVTHGVNEQDIRVPAYARTQPYAHSGGQRKNGGDTQSDRTQAEAAGGQWQGADSAAAALVDGSSCWLGDRGSCTNLYEEGVRLPLSLQGRYRRTFLEDWDRGGRFQPHVIGAAIPGSEEGRLLAGARVAGVEILEPTRDGTFSGVCPDGVVYNLAVEGNHNYFADGVLVHNCHHAVADTYRRILEQAVAFTDGGPLTLGVTATPQRGDHVGLDHVFQEIVYQKSLLEMITAGYLADLRAVQIRLKADFHQLHTRAGDLIDTEVESLLVAADAPENIVAAYREHAPGRKALLFTPTVQFAHAMAERLQKAGIVAEALDGTTPLEERRALLRRFHTGEIRVLANCSVLTEGFDEPSVDCILVARPTKSTTLFTQMIGRGTRLHPGKADCVVIDVAGTSTRHDLASVASLTGLPLESLHAGASVMEAHEEAVAMQEAHTQLRREIEARRVDLFRRRAMHWLQVEHAFTLSLGEHGWLVLTPEADEIAAHWRATVVTPDGARRVLASGLSLPYAQGTAEDFARQLGLEALVNPHARWRQQPASEKQIRLLQRLQVLVAPSLTMGEASDLISAVKMREAVLRAA